MKAVIFWIVCAAAFAQPIRPLPQNPRYFEFEGKPAVLITSGEHYGALMNLDFDYARYFDTLRADRLNLTRVFSGAYREVPGDFDIASNTLAPAPGRYIAPWPQRDGKFDLTKFDDAYFLRLRDLATQAARRGVAVEMVLFCPFYKDTMWDVSPMNAKNNRNGIGAVGREEVYTLRDAKLTGVQEALTRRIVSELRDFDNVYYEICNEPYFGGVTLAWQERIAQVIVESEREFPKKHLIAQNWANGSKTIDRPNPPVGLYNFHYSRPPESVRLNAALNKIIGNNETGFDGSADATYRIQGWEFLMAGGALYNNLDYSFTADHEDGTFPAPPSTPGGGSPALRRQLRYLRDFFDQIPFWRMAPAPASIRAPEGATAWMLAEPGRIWAAYLHHGGVVKEAKPRYRVDPAKAARIVRLDLPAGSYTAAWRDTRSGNEARTEAFRHAGGWREMESPPYAEDIALVVRAAPARTFRVLVSTDLGGDPDDIQSLYRLLHYSDVLKIEGIVSSPGPGAKNSAALIREWIGKIGVDRMRGRGFTQLISTQEALSLVKQGQQTPGAPSKGRRTEGSDWIVKRAHAAAGPLWVLVWGSATDVAQALHDDPTIASRIRIFYIGSSNTRADIPSRDYLERFLRERDPKLWLIESGVMPHRVRDTFRGVYQGGEQSGEWGNQEFMRTVVRSAGQAGQAFPLADSPRDTLKEGDSPSMLYLLAPALWGLGDPDDPTQPNWGGQYGRPDPQRYPNYYIDRNGDAADCQKTVSQWRVAFLGDWKTRWAWYGE